MMRTRKRWFEPHSIAHDHWFIKFRSRILLTKNGRSAGPRVSYMLVESHSAMDPRRFRMTPFPMVAVLFCWGLVCLHPLILRAQNPTAQLAGTISDQSGAPVPDARVQIAGVATGVEQITT